MLEIIGQWRILFTFWYALQIFAKSVKVVLADDKKDKNE